jgi:dihydrolipoamide dehydrogenase
MQQYDLCVIGGGPSGYAAAMRALDFNKKVLLIEQDKIGGAGVYNGALTSKTLWEISREANLIRRKNQKYATSSGFMDYNEIQNELREAIYERKSHLEHHLYRLQHLRDERLFSCIKGHGKLLGPNTVQITTKDARFCIHARHVILATGSRPKKLPHIPIDEKIIVTSDGIHHFDRFPESLVIIGAGVIGCEFATIFSNFGHTRVHIIAKENRILPFEDEDITKVIETNLEKNGVTIHRGANLVKIDIVQGRVQYSLAYADGDLETIEVEKALVSVGRIPNVENLGLENVGIELNDRGHIPVEDTQTIIENIYAVGDLTADIALVNVGELEGRYAVERIFSQPKHQLIYDNISTIMFLNPEIASVGMNEQQAIKAALSFKMVSIDYSCLSRAIAMRNTQGFFKILVTDDEEMKILGMRAIGEHASSAIQAVALLISMNKGIEELAELIHPHPSIIEGIQECVRMLFNKSIFKPEIFPENLQYRRYVKGVFIPPHQLKPTIPAHLEKFLSPKNNSFIPKH